MSAEAELVELLPDKQRIIYLITLSRSERSNLSRSQFAEIVVSAWNQCCAANVVQWVVGRENHAEEGEHFHMALKLDKKCRWSRVRRYLDLAHGIKVHFSDSHDTYYTAYSYCIKEDSEFTVSQGHPDLQGASEPKTGKATQKRKQSSKGKRGKKQRLSTYNVVQLIQERNIRSRLQLMALAAQMQKEGKTDLAEFVANRGPKVVQEALQTATELREAEEKLKRQTKSRLDILNEQLVVPCAEGCNEMWIQCAKSILESNGIDRTVFCQAIQTLLEKGRGKYRNVFIYGPANCGKTFLISPLKGIYNCFVNPTSGSFAWVGAEESEVILLNDLRWNSSLIPWCDLLQMLEGDTMHISAPKNFVKQDLVFDNDTPFFATSDGKLVLVKGGVIDRFNTEMMDVRWQYFELWKQIPQNEQKEVKPCGKCFATFILCKDLKK